MLLKLERPLSAGTGNDMHHLHVSEIEVLDVSGAKIELRPHDASPFVKKGYRSEGVFLSYEKAVDGDSATATHNDFGPGVQYGSEDHWMAFSLAEPHGTVREVHIVAKQPAWFCRAVGARVSLLRDGAVVWEHVFTEENVVGSGTGGGGDVRCEVPLGLLPTPAPQVCVCV